MTELWQIIERCWSQNPAQRSLSAEVVEDLVALPNAPISDQRPPNEFYSNSPSQLVYGQTKNLFSPLSQMTEIVKEAKVYHSGHREILGSRSPPLTSHQIEPAEDVEWYEDESRGDDDSHFVNVSLLSHIAVMLRNRVPRATRLKGIIPYPRAFTGKDIVVCFSLVILSLVFSDLFCSPASSLGSTESLLSTTVYRPTIAVQLSMLHEILKANCSSTKSNGTDVSSKMMSKTSTCS